MPTGEANGLAIGIDLAGRTAGEALAKRRDVGAAQCLLVGGSIIMCPARDPTARSTAKGAEHIWQRFMVPAVLVLPNGGTPKETGIARPRGGWSARHLPSGRARMALSF